MTNINNGSDDQASKYSDDSQLENWQNESQRSLNYPDNKNKHIDIDFDCDSEEKSQAKLGQLKHEENSQEVMQSSLEDEELKQPSY